MGNSDYRVLLWRSTSKRKLIMSVRIPGNKKPKKKVMKKKAPIKKAY